MTAALPEKTPARLPLWRLIAGFGVIAVFVLALFVAGSVYLENFRLDGYMRSLAANPASVSLSDAEIAGRILNRAHSLGLPVRMTDVLDNVVSRESDVRDVLAKIALGEADAGFVYATDARTVSRKVTVLRLPVWAQPNVAYGIAVVTASKHRAVAAAYLKMLLGKRAQATFRAYGFLPRRTPG